MIESTPNRPRKEHRLKKQSAPTQFRQLLAEPGFIMALGIWDPCTSIAGICVPFGAVDRRRHECYIRIRKNIRKYAEVIKELRIRVD